MEPVDGDKSLGRKIKPTNILNLRKGKGWKLEFFVHWTNNCCEWIFVHGIIYRLPEETEHFMTTYNLDFATCGYNMDPRLTSRKQRIFCDFEPLSSTKLKPLAGATRNAIDYQALTEVIFAKFKRVCKSYFFFLKRSEIVHTLRTLGFECNHLRCETISA